MLVNITCICIVWKKLPQDKYISIYLFTTNSDMFLKKFKHIFASLDTWELTLLFQYIYICTVSGGLQEAEKKERWY